LYDYFITSKDKWVSLIKVDKPLEKSNLDKVFLNFIDKKVKNRSFE